jgi:MFS family permease
MGMHQSSVYVGTALGGSVAGYCADYFGWRLGFYLFGGLGLGLAAILVLYLREPLRGAADGLFPKQRWDVVPGIVEVLRIPMVLVLTLVFIGANFVALVFLIWMPSYLSRQFGMSLSLSGFNATIWLQAASVAGVLSGGWLADRWVRRQRGGRALVQAVALLAGTPLVFATGWTRDIGVLVFAMAGFGFCKGLYDANIWASLYDVVPPRRRATAQGLMNALGWLGAGVASVAVAWASARYGMAACLSATSAVYLLCGGLLLGGIVTLRAADHTELGSSSRARGARGQ